MTDEAALWQAIEGCKNAIAEHAAAHRGFEGQFNLHDERYVNIMQTLGEMKSAREKSTDVTTKLLEKMNSSLDLLRTEMSESRGAKGALKWIIGLFGATTFGMWLKHYFG